MVWLVYRVGGRPGEPGAGWWRCRVKQWRRRPPATTPGSGWVQALIDLPEGAERPALGEKAKRSRRQAFLISLGYHPLSAVVPGRMLRLAHDASRDRAGPGPRCRGCAHFGQLDREGDPFERSQRCWFNKAERVTKGAATEVRGWWPACTDFHARG